MDSLSKDWIGFRKIVVTSFCEIMFWLDASSYVSCATLHSSLPSLLDEHISILTVCWDRGFGYVTISLGSV